MKKGKSRVFERFEKIERYANESEKRADCNRYCDT